MNLMSQHIANLGKNMGIQTHGSSDTVADNIPIRPPPVKKPKLSKKRVHTTSDSESERSSYDDDQSVACSSTRKRKVAQTLSGDDTMVLIKPVTATTGTAINSDETDDILLLIATKGMTSLKNTRMTIMKMNQLVHL
ncbi:hypothetical protein SNE40_021035 [Patella caerulea]|uniref:Uncharacterized protein n=1 Tax=Patella caerulea TaxID=87958 RepID=A0AAN8G1G9_PATCE